MENSLYYTFSTIAQTLGALMGLIGAIALFRLESIGAELRRRGRTLTDCFHEHAKLQEHLSKEDIEGFLAELRVYQAQVPITFKADEQTSLLLLQALSEHRDRIASLVKWSFFTGGITMVYSVSVLTSVHLIRSIGQEMLLAGLALFLVNVVQHGVLVSRLLR